MADYTNKFIDANGVKYLWKKAENIYVKKDGNKVLSDQNFSTEEKEKLNTLENYSLPNASAEVLGGIKIGTGLSIDEEGVVSTTGQVEAEVAFEDVTNKPTTLEGYGITDAASKDDLSEIQPEVLTPLDLDIIIGSASTVDSLRALIEEGGEIDLGCDMIVTETIPVTKNVILNLNKFTISSTDDNTIFMIDNATMTIKNGYTHSTLRLASTINNGSIELENVSVAQ